MNSVEVDFWNYKVGMSNWEEISGVSKILWWRRTLSKLFLWTNYFEHLIFVLFYVHLFQYKCGHGDLHSHTNEIISGLYMNL